MKRAVFAVLGIVLPLTVAAQDAAGPDAKPAPDSTVITAGGSAPQPAAPRRSTKRRGSMVGYIEDATIMSQLRIRFDAGFDMDSPDRAEFFYAKCGCYRDLAGSALFDADAPGPGPGLLQSLNFQQLYVTGEYAVNERFSLFAELPFRWIKPLDFLAGTGSFDNQGGVGDIKAGAKFGLVTDEARDVTVLVRASFPTGDPRKGLGSDHGSVEPAILYRQSLNDRAAIESQFGVWHPTGSSKGPLPSSGKFAGDVIYYGIGPSFDLVSTDRVRFSPVVELVGWHVVRGFETKTVLSPIGGAAKGINVVNLKFGARTSFANGGSFYVGYGVALTSDVWYEKVLRLEYRAGFGRF
jgi:hypothetical protein